VLHGEAEALTGKAIELALAGDVQCLKLCLDRILPSLTPEERRQPWLRNS
jgi:hypothetical protein